MDLKRLRKAIDSLDSRVLKLLNERAKIIHKVGKLKAKMGSSIYVPDREKDVYAHLVLENKGPLPNDSVKAIFREVMSSALNLERPIKIAYLGPEFTFTHLASMKKFGASVTYMGCIGITDVFNEVEKSRADYGVVPIENSIEGAVNHTLDMFADSDLKVCSEIYFEISQCLLANDIDKRKIKRVYSKAEVFAQCRSWLEANLYGVEMKEASSTARAAAIASREKGSACIASELAGKRYGLKVLYRGIEDTTHNVTRFLVIAKNDAKPTRHDKTSIMFSVKDRAGALHDMLVPFKKYKINLTKIESRPSKVRAWEYYFFVDLEGHVNSPKVAKALAELSKTAAFLKVLGSYPVGNGV